MLELDEAAAAAAMRELALEDEASIDRAVDATAARAHGRSLLEVESMLRAQLRQQGVELGDNTAQVAEQIARAINPQDPPTQWRLETHQHETCRY